MASLDALAGARSDDHHRDRHGRGDVADTLQVRCDAHAHAVRRCYRGGVRAQGEHHPGGFRERAARDDFAAVPRTAQRLAGRDQHVAGRSFSRVAGSCPMGGRGRGPDTRARRGGEATAGGRAGMRELRPYQKEAVAAVQAAVLGGDQRLLYVMATGLGKTEVFVELAKCLPGDGPALVLAHREELIGQAAHRLKEANPDLSIGIERAEHRADLDCAVVVGSVQTLGKANSTRLSSLAGRLRLIVVDEAHHAPAPSYLNVFGSFGCFDEDGPVLVGCTATPKRLDRLNLQAIFQRQVYDYPIRRGIDDGWLADIRGYRVEGKA